MKVQLDFLNIFYVHKQNPSRITNHYYPFKDKAQTVLFEDPVFITK